MAPTESRDQLKHALKKATSWSERYMANTILRCDMAIQNVHNGCTHEGCSPRMQSKDVRFLGNISSQPPKDRREHEFNCSSEDAAGLYVYVTVRSYLQSNSPECGLEKF